MVALSCTALRQASVLCTTTDLFFFFSQESALGQTFHEHQRAPPPAPQPMQAAFSPYGYPQALPATQYNFGPPATPAPAPAPAPAPTAKTLTGGMETIIFDSALGVSVAHRIDLRQEWENDQEAPIFEVLRACCTKQRPITCIFHGYAYVENANVELPQPVGIFLGFRPTRRPTRRPNSANGGQLVGLVLSPV